MLRRLVALLEDRLDSRRRSLLALVLAVAAFVGLNLFAAVKLDGARIDLTQDGLYSVSAGTRDVLRALDQPVRLRLYASQRILRANPPLSAYADRVRQMLRTYVDLAGGRLRLEEIDPEPFSVEEDRAISFGLRTTAGGSAGEQGFFGLAGTNDTDDVEVIPALTPDREPFLEYDLTRLVFALANPDRPIVALLDGLGLVGDPQRNRPPQAIVDPLRQYFQLRLLPPDAPVVPTEVRVLMVVHPRQLPERTLYAIDQYALQGGRVVVFVDPLAEGAAEGADPRRPNASSLDRLFAAWGLDNPAGQVVADRRHAQTVEAARGGRAITTSYLPWLSLRDDAIAAGQVPTTQLAAVHLASAGVLRPRPGAGTSVVPLLRSSGDSMLIPVERLVPSPDPFQIQRDFVPGGERHVLAARVSGTIPTAFPEGPVAGTAVPAHRRASVQPFEAVVVADTDLLLDGTWLEAARDGGPPSPIANNADFVLRAVDFLAGTSALLAMPARVVSARPFSTIEAMQREAAARFRDRERALLDRLRETEEQINRLAQENRLAGIDVILTAEQQGAIARARSAALSIRLELREVQRALRADIDRTVTLVEVTNIVLVPLAVALALLGHALWRRFGKRRSGRRRFTRGAALRSTEPRLVPAAQAPAVGPVAGNVPPSAAAGA